MSIKKTKLLFRHRSMEMGGVEKVLIDILENLDRDKFDIALLLNLNQGVLRNKIPKDISVTYLTEGRERFSKYKLIRALQFVVRRINLKIYKLFPQLTVKKIPFEPDVEVGLFHYDLPGLLNSPFQGSKKVCWLHSNFTILRDNFNIHKLSLMYNACDISVHVSQNTLTDAIECSGGIINNGVVIYNPFNKSLLIEKANEINIEFDPHAINFVSVGRLTEQKGYDLLYLVHKQLLHNGLLHKIHIIGNGPLFNELKNTVHNEGYEQTFILFGEISNPLPYIKAADFYIQSSRYEAYPLSIGEALTLKKVVISTEVGGIREMIKDENNGLIVNATVEGIYQGMERVMYDNMLVQEIKNNLLKNDPLPEANHIFEQINKILQKN